MKLGIEIGKGFSPNIKRLILRPRNTVNYKRCNDMPMKIRRAVCGEVQVAL
jgi:hypothetical protein